MKYTLFYLLTLLTFSLFAQDELQLLTPGGAKALHMKSENNRVITLSKPIQEFHPSLATDCNGNLLFYSSLDGIMTKNGTLMKGGDQYIPEGDVIVYYFSMLIPLPFAKDQYAYICCLNKKSYCSFIDASANGGLGEVLKTEAFATMNNPEAIEAIISGTRCEILIANSQSIHVFSIDRDLQFNEEKEFLVKDEYHSDYYIHEMALSYDGSLIACHARDSIFLMEYDYKKRQIKKRTSLGYEGVSSLEFSKSGKFLYVATAKRIMQIDLSDRNRLFSQQLIEKETIITEYFIEDTEKHKYLLGDLQLAPDGKIYCTGLFELYFENPDYVFVSESTALDVIHEPDLYWEQADYERGGIELSEFRNIGYIQDYPHIHNRLMDINGKVLDTICIGEGVPFTIGQGKQYVLWNFGDPASGLSNYSRQANPYHAYTKAGSYEITVTHIPNDDIHDAWPYGCDDKRTFTVEVRPSPHVELTGNTELCKGSNALFTATGANKYYWNILDDTLSTISFKAINQDMVKVVGITDGCSASDSLPLDIKEGIEPLTNSVDTLCGSTRDAIYKEGNNIRWYESRYGSAPIAEGNSFMPVAMEAGLNRWYVTWSNDECESPPSTVDVYFSPINSLRIKGDSLLCEGNDVSETYTPSEAVQDIQWKMYGDNVLEIEGRSATVSFFEIGVDTLFLSGYSAEGCFYERYQPLYYTPQPIAEFEFIDDDRLIAKHAVDISDKVMLEGSGIELQNVARFTIDDGKNITFPLVENNSAVITGNGQIEVTMTIENIAGCRDSVLKDIYIDNTCTLYFPNAVMPMNSAYGVSHFLPKGFNLRTYEFWIYDNYGNTIWYTDKLQNGSPAEAWNCRFGDELVENDIYIWKCEAQFKDGSWWGKSDTEAHSVYGEVVVVQ